MSFTARRMNPLPAKTLSPDAFTGPSGARFTKSAAASVLFAGSSSFLAGLWKETQNFELFIPNRHKKTH